MNHSSKHTFPSITPVASTCLPFVTSRQRIVLDQAYLQYVESAFQRSEVRTAGVPATALYYVWMLHDMSIVRLDACARYMRDVSGFPLNVCVAFAYAQMIDAMDGHRLGQTKETETHALFRRAMQLANQAPQ